MEVFDNTAFKASECLRGTNYHNWGYNHNSLAVKFHYRLINFQFWVGEEVSFKICNRQSVSGIM